MTLLKSGTEKPHQHLQRLLPVLTGEIGKQVVALIRWHENSAAESATSPRSLASRHRYSYLPETDTDWDNPITATCGDIQCSPGQTLRRVCHDDDAHFFVVIGNFFVVCYWLASIDSSQWHTLLSSFFNPHHAIHQHLLAHSNNQPNQQPLFLQTTHPNIK